MCSNSCLISPALPQTTVAQYLTYATSSFEDHGALGIILTAQAIAGAAFRPFATKANALMAASTSISMYAAGNIIGSLGGAALYTLPSAAIIVYSSALAKNQRLQSFMSVPYYVMGWIGSFIVNAVLGSIGWRWGVGMFCILTPLFVAPLVLSLFVAERRKKKADAGRTEKKADREAGTGEQGDEEQAAATFDRAEKRSSNARLQRWKKRGRKALSREGHLVKLDATGLILLAVSLGGTLLPITLVGEGSFTWSSPLFYGLLIGGGIALILLIANEYRTPYPLFPLGVYRERRTIIGFTATFLNFTSFYILLTYQYSFIQVMYPKWSPLYQGFFSFSELFTMTLVHLLASFPATWAVKAQTVARRDGQLDGEKKGLKKHPMYWICAGHGLRVLAVGLMIPSRKIGGRVWLLVVSQVVHGAGGAVANVWISQIALHAVEANGAANPCIITADADNRYFYRDPADRSMVFALNQLVGDIGNALGTAVATLLWRHFLPSRLTANLKSLLSQTDIDAIFESTLRATSYDEATETSVSIRTSYVEVMSYLLYLALGIASLSFVMSFFIGDAEIVEDEVKEENPAAPLPTLVIDPNRPWMFSRDHVLDPTVVGRALEMGHRRRRREKRYAGWARQGLEANFDSSSGDEEERHLVASRSKKLRVYSSGSSLSSDEEH
ncbi:hypothetical protein JCM11641_002134 [Rhodosporidiobolus odoratus]